MDGRAVALHYNGTDVYVYIRVDGGFTNSPLLTAASENTQQWTRSVGPANSGNFAIIARLDLTTGNVTDAAFITAILSNGNSNSVGIKDILCTTEGNIRLRADSFFSPRRINGSAMTNNGAGGSPHDYTVDLTVDLKDVLYTSAINWETIGTPSTVTACPNSSLSAIGGKLDTNGDNLISPTDVMLVVNALTGATFNNAADIDSDGSITLDDVQAVIRQLGEIIP